MACMVQAESKKRKFKGPFNYSKNETQYVMTQVKYHKIPAEPDEL